MNINLDDKLVEELDSLFDNKRNTQTEWDACIEDIVEEYIARQNGTWEEDDVYEEDEECLECRSREEQYQRIRSAFDRRKQQHQAIAEFFKHYHFTHNGQRMSLTKLIQYGLDLQKQK